MKRKEGESFDNYRQRRKEEAAKVKSHLKGRVIWPSAIFGTAVKQYINGNPYYVNGEHRVRLA